MSSKKVTKVLLSQLEEALEERDGGDRRKTPQGLPDTVSEERRKNDRRNDKDENPNNKG